MRLFPLMDLTRVLHITLKILHVSDRIKSTIVDSLPSGHLMILGMIRIKSFELSKLSVITTDISSSGICTSCDAVIEDDLPFCPACGENR